MRRGHVTNTDGSEEGPKIGILRDDYEWFRRTFAPGVARPPFGMMLHRLREALEITLTDEAINDLRMNWAIDEANWEHWCKEHEGDQQ